MKINLFDHLPEKTFILVTKSYRESLFSSEKTLTSFSKDVKIPLKNLSRYKNGSRGIPKKIFLQLVKVSKRRLEDFQGKIIIKVGKIGNCLAIGPLLTITPEWVYISELMRGDGSLSRGNNDSFHLTFTNKDVTLIKNVKKFFLKLGILDHSITIYDHIYHSHIKQLTVNSEIVSYLLHSLFLIPFGRKKRMGFPEFISQNKEFSISAIKGIFDAEGCVHLANYRGYDYRSITIVSFDKSYLGNIKKIMNKLVIHCKIYSEKRKNSKLFHRLKVQDRDSALRFAELIKPFHSVRSVKLKKLAKSYKSKKLSSKTINLQILRELQNKHLRRSQLSGLLHIPNTKFSFFLQDLQKKKLIHVTDKVITNKGGWFVYGITTKGKSYLKRYSEDFS